MFVQYYSKLIESLQDHAYQLYEYMFPQCSTSQKYRSTRHDWIAKYFEFEPDNSVAELLLAIQAMELYSGRTSLLYEMLKFMESSKEHGHRHLAREIQLNIKRFDPNNSSGM